VRNGRIGELQTVEIGLPGDPSGDDEPKMPVPQNLNYDMWLVQHRKSTTRRSACIADRLRPAWMAAMRAIGAA